MFGYVKTCTPELRVKENEFYRALYCGLCREMGRRSPFLSLSLSYDFVFLALVRLGLSGEEISFGKKRCVSHPFRKRLYVKSTPTLRYAASVSALLLYYNLMDDLSDQRGVRRCLSSLCLPKARSMRKAALGDGVLDRKISECLSEISEFEDKNAPGIYVCAEPFGRLLGEVFSAEVDDPSESRCLYELGRRIGRWIYLMDALDDLEEDRKLGNYNPFLCTNEDKSEHFSDNIQVALTMELVEAGKALDLLTFRDEGMLSIVQNILNLGLPKIADEILNRDNSKSVSKLKRSRKKTD